MENDVPAESVAGEVPEREIRRRRSPKGDAKRREILRAALKTLGQAGYKNTSVRDIAQAVGLSPTGLLHHFESKDELFAQLILARDEVRNPSEMEPVARVRSMADRMRENETTPGLNYLFTSVTAEAGHPDHPSHEFIAERYARLRGGLSESLAAVQASADAGDRRQWDPETASRLIVALADGLQIQWLLDRDIDMAGDVNAFLDLLGIPDRVPDGPRL